MTIIAAAPLKRRQGKYRPKGYWASEENQRAFLCGIAEQMGFDPYKPENWDRVSYAHILEQKVPFWYF